MSEFARYRLAFFLGFSQYLLDQRNLQVSVEHHADCDGQSFTPLDVWSTQVNVRLLDECFLGMDAFGVLDIVL